MGSQGLQFHNANPTIEASNLLIVHPSGQKMTIKRSYMLIHAHKIYIDQPTH